MLISYKDKGKRITENFKEVKVVYNKRVFIWSYYNIVGTNYSDKCIILYKNKRWKRANKLQGLITIECNNIMMGGVHVVK